MILKDIKHELNNRQKNLYLENNNNLERLSLKYVFFTPKFKESQKQDNKKRSEKFMIIIFSW